MNVPLHLLIGGQIVADLFDDQTLIESYLNNVKDSIIKASYAQKRVATGKTVASIVPLTGISIGGQIVANANILNTEFGTSPAEAQKQDYLTLVESLKVWKRAKGLPDTLNEYAIADNLRKFGSKLYREGGRSGVLSNTIDEKELNDLLVKLSNIYLQQGSSIIFK